MSPLEQMRLQLPFGLADGAEAAARRLQLLQPRHQPPQQQGQSQWKPGHCCYCQKHHTRLQQRPQRLCWMQQQQQKQSWTHRRQGLLGAPLPGRLG